MTAQKARAGHAEVTASIKDRISGGLAKIKAKMQSFAVTSARIGGGLIGGALAGGALFVKPIASASRLQETMAKFDVVFGDNSATVNAWAKQFADDMGRSDEQIASFMAGSQDLLVPMGLEPGAATEMSKQITGLAIDLASFNNTSDADAHNDLQAALTGSGEVTKKYGVVLDEAATKQELLNQGFNPASATNAQKVQARLAIIMKGTTAAQGDAIRSGHSWANVQKRIFAEADNALAIIGTALLPTLSKYGEKLAWLVQQGAAWASNNQTLFQYLALGVGVVGALGVAILAMAGAAYAVSTAIGLVNGVVALGTGAVTVFTAALAIAGALLSFIASPIGIVAALLVGGAAAWLHYSGAANDAINWTNDRLGQLLTIGKSTFEGIYDAITAGRLDLAAKIALTGVKLVFATILEEISGLFGTSIDDMMQGLAAVIKRIGEMASKLNVVRQQAINWLSSAIAGLGVGAEEDERGRRLEAQRKAMLESKGLAFTANDTSLATNLANDQQRDLENAQEQAEAWQGWDAEKAGQDWSKSFDPTALQAELDALNAAAKLARAEVEAPKQAATPTAAQKSAFEAPKQSAIKNGLATSSLGSFNLASLNAFGSVKSKEGLILDATNRVADNTEKIADNIGEEAFVAT